MEALKFLKIPLYFFINIDQTSVNLITAEKKTLENRGAKHVRILCPTGDKIVYTVVLLIRANGEKLPAITVFKTASKSGKLSQRELDKLNIPENVV